jgi:hypothetical protein
LCKGCGFKNSYHKTPLAAAFAGSASSFEATEYFLVAVFVACLAVLAAAAPEVKSD